MDRTEQVLDHIRVAAYYKWEQAGRIEGDGIEFWLAAEREYGEKSNGAGNSARSKAQRASKTSPAKQLSNPEGGKRKRR